MHKRPKFHVSGLQNSALKPDTSLLNVDESKEAPVKYSIVTILFSVLVLSFSAHADCVKNQYGDVVCGKGQCDTDQYGKVFCADLGGGAIRDRHATVRCGVGYCEKDSFGKVWCSRELGGAAAVDSYGKVKCVGGCEKGSAKRCQEAR